MHYKLWHSNNQCIQGCKNDKLYWQGTFQLYMRCRQWDYRKLSSQMDRPYRLHSLSKIQNHRRCKLQQPNMQDNLLLSMQRSLMTTHKIQLHMLYMLHLCRPHNQMSMQYINCCSRCQQNIHLYILYKFRLQQDKSCN